MLDSAFEMRLIDAIRPIKEHFFAQAIHHFFDTGIYLKLEGCAGQVEISTIADDLGMNPQRLRGFLLYLVNEGVVIVEGDSVQITKKGRDLAEFQAWYTLMIGGYAGTLCQMGDALYADAPHCSRNARLVGLGSCEMSRYDGIPLTHSLMEKMPARCTELLDLGCGNGLYLTEFCRSLPGISAWGAEPDEGGYREAIQAVQAAGLGDRVHLKNCSASQFLAAPPDNCKPELVVFGFVLHEILAQEGRTAVVRLLRDISERFPGISIIVIEVANEITNSSIMKHGLSANFWNPYFLLHYFTNQQLEKKQYWDDLFAESDLETIAFETVDRRVDSTGMELGYLLQKSQNKSTATARR